MPSPVSRGNIQSGFSRKAHSTTFWQKKKNTQWPTATFMTHVGHGDALTHVWLRLANVPKLDLLRLLRVPWAVAQHGSVPPANRVAVCQTVHRWDAANREDLQNAPRLALCLQPAAVTGASLLLGQLRRRCPSRHRQWGVSVCQCPLCRNIACLHFNVTIFGLKRSEHS